MSATINAKESVIGSEYLKRAAGLISGSAKRYITDVMPTTSSTISEAKRTASELKSTISSTANQQVLPILRKLKIQPSFKNISNWFLEKEDEYGGMDDGSNLSFDIEGDATTEIAEEQISEIAQNANQISQAVVESSGKLAEAQMTATANLISVAEKQMSVIAAGFDKTNETLNKILEVLTKNTSAIIESTVASATRSENDRMISSGKFSLSGYKNIIKENAKNNPELSLLTAFLPMFTDPGTVKDMMSSTNIIGGFLDWGINKGVNKFAPNFKKNARALDDAISDTLLSSLVRLGENKDYGIKGSLAKLFGIDPSKKAADTSRSELELKAVPFDSVTKEAITNAIPGYLRKILVAVGGDDVIYDYTSRSFRTKKAIHDNFKNSVASTGTLRSASNNVRKELGDGKMANMLYDLMMVDLGSKTDDGEYRDIIRSFEDVKNAEDYINKRFSGLKLSKKDMREKKLLAQRLSKASSGMGGIDIGNQVARTNINRNHRSQQLADQYDAYGMDISEIEDGDLNDIEVIHNNYGAIKKTQKKRGKASIKAAPSSGRENLTGINYANVALFEIFRRLNEGINVFQVGSSTSQTSKFERFDEKVLPKPDGHKPKSIPRHDEMSTFTGGSFYRDNTNDNEDEGNDEELSKGQKFAKWGKKRGTRLARAMFSGSPDEVKEAFGDIFRDATGAGKNLFNKGVTKVNDKFGNVGGYVKHKIFGTGYSYTGDDGKEVRIKEGKGALGFITDEFKGMFENAKKNSSQWIKTTMSFFDKPDKGDDDDPGVASKRKKLLGASIGAFAGAGLLGGPLGIIMGGLAGNALASKKIGKKINKLLFGYDDEGENATGKATGIISKAADAVISPVKFQLSKTIAFSGAMLQKHVFGPMSDLGRSITDRIHNHVDSIFDKAKQMAGKAFGKVFGFIGKGAAKLATGIATMGHKIGATAAGKTARGAIGAATGLIGAIQTKMSNKIAGKRSFHKLKKGEVYALLVGDHYLDPTNSDTVKVLHDGSEVPNHTIEWMPEYGKYGIWLNGDNKNELMPRTKDYNKRKRKERNTEINDNLKKSGFYSQGGVLGFLGGDYLKWRKQDRLNRMEKRTGFKNALKEAKMSPEEIAAANAAEQEKNRKQQEELAEKQQETTQTISDNVENIIDILEDGPQKGKRKKRRGKGKGSQNNATKPETTQETTTSIDESGDSGFGNAVVGAIADISSRDGMDQTETKTSLDALDEAAKDKPDKKKLSSLFSNIIKHNRATGEVTEEKKENSFISKLLGGLGSGLMKYWPLVLGAFTLLSSKFRDAIFGLGSYLLEKLPGALKDLFNFGKDALEDLNTTVEANAYDATTVDDEVTGETKGVVSAETHAEHLKQGIFKTALDATFDPLDFGKDALMIGGIKSGVRLGATGIKVLGGATSVGGGLTNLASRGMTAAGTKFTTLGYDLTMNGARGGKFFTSLGKGLTSAGAKGSSIGSSMTSGGAKLAAGADTTKSVFSKFSPKKLFNFKDAKVANAWGGILAGTAGQIGAGLGWNAMETAKNANIVGDYGLGRAGGFVMTNTTVSTVTSITASVGATALAGAALGAQITAAAGAITAAGGLAALGTSQFWNPVGWALLIIAGVVAIAAAFAALVNWITGILTDKSDRAYAIRSNSSKIKGVKDGSVTYKNGQENPTYVYCAQESDRTIGLTKGLNIADPEIVFGRYVKTIMDGLASSPGSEVLLYDWINNMAVQGVPFACYLAGDSEEVSAKGDHANKNTTGDPMVDRKGPLGGQYTMVKKSTVKKYKDEIYADIVENINRQNPDVSWSWDVLENIYEYGKEVVKALKNSGILKDNGSVNTDKFKGKPGDSKNAEGWDGLKDICKKKGSYFLTKCLVYINSKIEADKKTGEQWLEKRKDDVSALLDSLKDVLMKESQELVDEMRSKGMSDEEIEQSLKDAADPKSGKATGAADLTSAADPLISSLAPGIKASDQASVSKELQYINAAYAYSHPTYLQKWVENHRNLTEFGIDDVQGGNIANWDKFTTDSRKKKSLRSKMKSAALAFGQQAGDIFNLLPQFDWSDEGKIYGKGSKKVNNYGAAFVLRGQEKKEGEGILDKIFESTDDITPDDVHDKMYGRIRHNMGAEAKTVNGQDPTLGGNGVIARIADKMSDYSSTEGEQLAQGSSSKKWKNILVNMPAKEPVNLPDPSGTSTVDVDDAVGGPKSLPSFTAIDDGGSGSTTTIQPENKGNPFGNRPFRVTSNYGWRDLDDDGTLDDFHKGIDIVQDDGGVSPDVFSTFSGTISKVVRNVPDSHTGLNQDTDQGGNMVWIDTDDGLRIKNMHFKSGSIPSGLQEGQKISAGTKIGTMGSTGRSSGAHLHYQIDTDPNNGDSHIDPLSSITGEPISYNSNEYSSSYSSYSSYNDWDNTSMNSEDTSDSGSGILGSFINLITKIGQGFIGAVTGIFGNSNSSSNGTSGNTGYGSINYGNSTFLTGNCNSEWITVVRDVKKLVADQHPPYNQQGSIYIEYRGKRLKVRTDCTGIICAMLKFYGVMDDNDNLNTTLMFNSNAIKQGFTQASFPGWDKLVEGDILVNDSHAEIFAMNDGSKHYVYNGGSTEALGTPGATSSSKSTYKIIWRCNEKVSYSTLGNGASVTADSATIWKMLKSKGLSDYAVAGLMGNLYAESGLRSDNLQNTYESKFGLNDQQYTAAVNSGSYGNFVNDSAGYGLAQWTYSSRKQNLLNFARSRGTSIDDTGMQIDFLMNELQSGYSGVLNGIKNSNSVQSASDIVLTQFERPADQSSSVKAKRAGYGQTFYNQFAGMNDYSVGGTNEKNRHVGGESSEIFSSNFVPRTATHNASRIPKLSSYSLGTTNHEYHPVQNTGTYEYSSEGTNSSFNNDEITKLLYDVLSELQQITGNTGESADLLGSLNEKDFVDAELRDSLSSLGKSKNTTQSTSVPTSRNVNRILSIATP